MRQTVARAAFHVRSAFADWWGFAAAGAFAALVSRGFFLNVEGPASDPVRFLLAAALCALLVARLLNRLRAGGLRLSPAAQAADGGTGEIRSAVGGRFSLFARDMELGLLLVVAAHALLQLAGGATSSFYPILYALACFLVATNGPAVGAVLILASLGLEAAALWSDGRLAADRQMLALHAALMSFFGAVAAVILHTEVAKLRRRSRHRHKEELGRMRQEARDFRLIATSLSASGEGRSRGEQLERLWRGSVQSIHQGLFFTLEMIKQSLELQSCVLLWLDDSGTRLYVKEAVSDSDMISESSVPARAGVVVGVLKNRAKLHLCPVKQGYSAFPYYVGPEEVGSFLAVPVIKDRHIRGVLCADRRAARPFEYWEQGLLEGAARQVLRTIESERLFCAVERSKYEQERFFKASEMLNRAWGLNRVLETAFQAARQIVEFQTAAVTLYNRRRKRHKVAATWGEALDGTRDLEFADNSSLTAMAVKNKHYLPVGGRHRRNQVVFTRKVSLKQMRSVLVFPLIVGDKAIGTFMMASQTPDLFTEDRREMLGVICNQMAVSIQNGMMVRKLEELATTDGLTGLSNHRTFQERLTEMMARAERSGRLVSLVLCDIDHFKSVNDNHGHPVGDTVLRRVAQVLASSVRAIDVVARYGGEEFAVVLEETDVNGALLLAERIREEVSQQQFSSDQGPFNCTMSFGIATYPEHGAHKQLLIEHADQALYRAKQSGRNCTVCFTG